MKSAILFRNNLESRVQSKHSAGLQSFDLAGAALLHKIGQLFVRQLFTTGLEGYFKAAGGKVGAAPGGVAFL